MSHNNQPDPAPIDRIKTEAAEAPQPTPPGPDPAAGAQASPPAESPPFTASAGAASSGSAPPMPDISDLQQQDEEPPDWESDQPTPDGQPDPDDAEKEFAAECEDMFINIGKGAARGGMDRNSGPKGYEPQ